MSIVSYIGTNGPRSATRRRDILNDAAGLAARLQLPLYQSSPVPSKEYLSLHIVDRKFGENGKGPLLQRQAIAAFIDDSPDVLEDISYYGVAGYWCRRHSEEDREANGGPVRRNVLLCLEDLAKGRVPAWLPSRRTQ